MSKAPKQPKFLVKGWIQVSKYMIKKYGYELAVLLAAGNKIVDQKERILWKKNWIMAYFTRGGGPAPNLPPGSTRKPGLITRVGDSGAEQIMKADGTLFLLPEMQRIYVDQIRPAAPTILDLLTQTDNNAKDNNTEKSDTSTQGADQHNPHRELPD